MPLGRITVNPTRSVSWRLDLFWVLASLTIACGFWELGGLEEMVWAVSVLCAVFVGCIGIMRLLGYMIFLDTQEKILYSLLKGAVWGAAMIFAWPDSGVGPVYLIVIFLNFCLLEIRRPKKG